MSSLHYMREHSLCLLCARKKCYHPEERLGARARRRWIRQGPKREFMSKLPPLDMSQGITTDLFFDIQHRELQWFRYKQNESLLKHIRSLH